MEPLAGRPGGDQGAGWMLERRRRSSPRLPPGLGGGFESTLVLVPDRRVAVAALANSARGSAAFEPVVDALLEALADVPPWSPSLVAIAPGELEELAGRYAGPDEEVVVEARDGTLAVRLAERDPFTRHDHASFPSSSGIRPDGGRSPCSRARRPAARFDFPGARFRMGSVLADRVP